MVYLSPVSGYMICSYCLLDCLGLLCGTCVDGHGVTLDLQTCSSTSCTAGLVLFVFFCKYIYTAMYVFLAHITGML